jgi:hypothetical protein
MNFRKSHPVQAVHPEQVEGACPVGLFAVFEAGLLKSAGYGYYHTI